MVLFRCQHISLVFLSSWPPLDFVPCSVTAWDGSLNQPEPTGYGIVSRQPYVAAELSFGHIENLVVVVVTGLIQAPTFGFEKCGLGMGSAGTGEHLKPTATGSLVPSPVPPPSLFSAVSAVLV
jgi:hypothetical protein